VAIDLGLRISFQIVDVPVFCANPIEYVDYMRNYVQDEMLDRFAKTSLR